MSPTIEHPKNEGVHVFQRWSDRITRCLLRVAREWAIWAANCFSTRPEILSTCKRGSIYLNSHDCLQHATSFFKICWFEVLADIDPRPPNIFAFGCTGEGLMSQSIVGFTTPCSNVTRIRCYCQTWRQEDNFDAMFHDLECWGPT